MNNITSVFFLTFILMAVGFGEERKIYSFSSKPNDWFRNYEFRTVLPKDPKRVKTVIIATTNELGKVDSYATDQRWDALLERDDFAVVCVGYKYQTTPPKGATEPMSSENPEEALNLLDQQSRKQIEIAYPRARNFAYFANDSSSELIRYLLRHEPKSVEFWIAENTSLFLPEDSGRLPEGLVINTDSKALPEMLEAQISNVKSDANALFLRFRAQPETAKNEAAPQASIEQRTLQQKQTGGYSSDKVVDDFVVSFIDTISSRSRLRPLLVDIVSESEIRTNDKQSAGDYVTRLPDEELIEPWSLANDLNKSECLPTVVETTIETGVSRQPELTLYLKLPKTSGSEEAAPKGVVCIVTWFQEERSLKETLLHGRINPNLLKWADDNQMAVITWNTNSVWQVGVSQEDLDRKTGRNLDDEFDDMVLAWEKGVRRFITKYQFPERGYTLYGMSRGAQWGHRLVLRKPERFSAVHIHIGSSFDLVNEASRDVLWLVTTGELDSGYQSSLKFYKDGCALGYPMMIKAGPNLAHGGSKEIEKLGLDFFKYSLDLKETVTPGRQPNTDESTRIADLMRNDLQEGKFFGDFINQEVYSGKEGDWVPEEQRIPLVSEEIAEAWSPSVNK